MVKYGYKYFSLLETAEQRNAVKKDYRRWNRHDIDTKRNIEKVYVDDLQIREASKNW